MNWKKLGANVLGLGVASFLAPWAAQVASGNHVALTAGNTVIPGIIPFVGGLAALFQQAPHKDGK